uniref:Uncharacterized protein n=1 Tax=Rhizophora mucronata TaxID=61149 RepID=A0A2P2JE90_RHIMU
MQINGPSCFKYVICPVPSGLRMLASSKPNFEFAPGEREFDYFPDLGLII